MTDAELTRLLELWEGTTAGPWFWNGYSQIQSAALVNEYNQLEAEVPDDAPEDAWPHLPQVGVLYVKPRAGDTPSAQGEADLIFVEAVHTALPALVAEVRRLQGLHWELNAALDVVETVQGALRRWEGREGAT